MSDTVQSAAEALQQTLETQQVQEGSFSTETGEVPVEAAPKPAPEAEKPQTEEEKRFASKFAALARKEKQAREAEKKIQEAQKALEARIKAIEEKEAALANPPPVPKKPLEDRLFENPFEALSEAGLDYETLTRTALNDGKLPPEIQIKRLEQQFQTKLQAEIAAIRKEREDEKRQQQEELEKRAKEAAEQEQSKALSQFKEQIKLSIDSKKDDLSLVAAEGEYGVQAIFDLIAEDAQKKREELGDEAEIELLTIEEAAAQVEERLLNKAKEYVKLQKIQGLFGQAPKEGQNSTVKPPNKAATTLSNTNSQVQGQPGKHLSEEQRMRLAAQSIKFLSEG